MESAPYVVTNMAQPMTLNDKLLVRPRLLFARTRSKDSARVAASEIKNSFAAPDFEGKYASWSEYDRTSSPSLHLVKKEPMPQAIVKTTVAPLQTPDKGETKMKLPNEKPEDKIKNDTSKKTARDGVKREIPDLAARQETMSEPVAIEGNEDAADQIDLSKDDSDRNSGQDIEDHDTKVDEEPEPNRYDGEVGKEGYHSSGYIQPGNVPETPNIKDNADVPRYPPLDREKLYNKSFLIYLKDFRPDQY